MSNQNTAMSANAAGSANATCVPSASPVLNISPAQPFLKWAGGKRSMLPSLLPFVPAEFGAYHEPFVGGGAMFFALNPKPSVLSDNNPELIDCYLAVQQDVESVIGALGRHQHDEKYFYAVRSQRPSALQLPDRAARTIFLNRTCFNGLYRVNRQGRFNVPFGRYEAPTICNAPALRACSAALQSAAISQADFATVLSRAVAGDFVYFDPPYLPISGTSKFTSYTSNGFSLHDHTRLRDVARELKARGVHVLLSNSAAPAIVNLYSQDFQIIRVQAGRAINAKGSGRAKVEELIIR
jgi:DNA adenine methylase